MEGAGVREVMVRKRGVINKRLSREKEEEEKSEECKEQLNTNRGRGVEKTVVGRGRVKSRRRERSNGKSKG
jgi:hypothetical protein